MKRILTALVLIPVVVYAVLFAGYYVFLAILAACALLSYYEYNSIATGYGFGEPGTWGYGAGLAVLAWQGESWPLLTLIAITAIAAAMRDETLSKALPRSALLVFGVAYVFGCWKAAIPLHNNNPHWLMYALLLNWIGDTGAYYFGSLFGKHKLAPRVSPKKSWEGAAASLVFSILGGGAYLWHFIPDFPVWQIVVLTAISNAAGQLGDLAESAMKRGAGTKDSSTILPGHGGFLDRVDSTLFTMPVIYLWLRLAA